MIMLTLFHDFIVLTINKKLPKVADRNVYIEIKQL